jgi:hypothetical protein
MLSPDQLLLLVLLLLVLVLLLLHQLSPLCRVLRKLQEAMRGKQGS